MESGTRSYEKPTLTDLGSVYELTLGLCNGNRDPGISGNTPSNVTSITQCR